MDLQEYLTKAVAMQRASRLKDSDQMTLGSLIAAIEPIVAKQKERIADEKSEATVCYDFGYMIPHTIDSWRGAYEELALDYSETGETLTVSQFLEMLKEAVGKEFDGYKGGEFVMSESTPIWVANYGQSGSTALVDVIDNDYQVILVTGFREY